MLTRSYWTKLWRRVMLLLSGPSSLFRVHLELVNHPFSNYFTMNHHLNITTVVATHEARKVEIIPSTIGDDSVWTKIDHNSLKEMIA